MLWALHHPPNGYPRGVKAVPAPLQGLGFFPGGYGMWNVDSSRSLPPFPVGGVMVLAHDFHSEAGYLASFKLGGERLSMPTWRNLLKLFEAALVARESCFFTNIYMGLREGAATTGPFPGAHDSRFVDHCKAFLVEQIRVQRPSLIVSLGQYVPPFLAQVSVDLVCWHGLKGFKAIDAAGPVRDEVTIRGVDDFKCTVVALLHPSLRHASLRHRRFQDLVGAEAELSMLTCALTIAGLADAPPRTI